MKLGPRSHRDRGERGSQIVEFALLMPVLAFMSLMVLDGGRALTTYGALKNAVRESAIYASKNISDPTAGGYTAEISQVIQDESNGFLQSSAVQSVNISDTVGTYHTDRSVTVTYRFQFVNPILTSPLWGAGSTNKNLDMSVTAAWPVN